MSFKINFKGKDLDLTNKSIIMGILNISPESPIKDSIIASEQALERARYLKQYGASIIDIGGNSSSSKAINISTEIELERVIPVIEKLVQKNFLVSLDSWNPEVAEEAAKKGVHLLNDINGLQNPKMVDIALEYDLSVCIMHMRGNPKQHYLVDQVYQDVVGEVFNWFKNRIEELENKGFNRNKLILDPGFEFGKPMIDNLRLLRYISKFLEFGRPLLVSASRKAFIAEAIGLGHVQSGQGLLEATLAVQTLLTYMGVHVIRVHDVKEANYIVEFVNKLKEV